VATVGIVDDGAVNPVSLMKGKRNRPTQQSSKKENGENCKCTLKSDERHLFIYFYLMELRATFKEANIASIYSKKKCCFPLITP
jgi:hypothetical protein